MLYVAKHAVCGHIRAAFVDPDTCPEVATKEVRKDLAKCLADWIKRGYRVERVEPTSIGLACATCDPEMREKAAS